MGELVQLAAKGGAGTRSVQNGDSINSGPPRGRKLLGLSSVELAVAKVLPLLIDTYPRICAKYVEFPRMPHLHSPERR